MNSPISQMWEQFCRINRLMHKPEHPCRVSKEIVLLRVIKQMSEKQAEGVKASEVSRHLELAQPTITPVIQKLVQEGKLVRIDCSRDRRASRLKLTAKGEQYYQSYLDGRQAWAQELADYLTPEGVTALTELLEKTADFMSRTDRKESEENLSERGMQ